MGFLISRVIHDTSCIVSIFLNVLMITLILVKTPERLRYVSFRVHFQLELTISSNYSFVLLNFPSLSCSLLPLVYSSSTGELTRTIYEMLLLGHNNKGYNSLRIMSTDAYDLNAITGPCYLTGCFLDDTRTR